MNSPLLARIINICDPALTAEEVDIRYNTDGIFRFHKAMLPDRVFIFSLKCIYDLFLLFLKRMQVASASLDVDFYQEQMRLVT